MDYIYDGLLESNHDQISPPEGTLKLLSPLRVLGNVTKAVPCCGQHSGPLPLFAYLKVLAAPPTGYYPSLTLCKVCWVDIWLFSSQHFQVHERYQWGGLLPLANNVFCCISGTPSGHDGFGVLSGGIICLCLFSFGDYRGRPRGQLIGGVPSCWTIRFWRELNPEVETMQWLQEALKLVAYLLRSLLA